MTDTELRFTSVTGQMCADLGIHATSLIDTRLMETFPDPESATVAMEACRRALSGEPDAFAGTWFGRRLQTRLQPYRDEDGAIVGVLGLSTTAANNADDASRQADTDSVFRTTFEQAAVGMAVCDVEGRFVRVNEAFCRITGYAASELMSRKRSDIAHEDDRCETERQVQRVVAGEISTFSLDKRYVRKDGSLVWVSLTISAHRQGGQVAWLLGVIEDITSRIATVQALEEERSYANAIFDATGAFLVVTDAWGRIIQCNEACATALGYEAEDVLGRTPWQLFVHPDEQESVARRYRELHRMSCDEARRRFAVETEHRWRTRGGAELCVSLTTTYHPAHDGTVRYVITSGTDVTERRTAEERLSASEARLRAIFEAEPECVQLVNPDGTVAAINSAGLRIIEVDRSEDVLGMSVLDCVDAPYRQDWQEAIEAVFLGESRGLEFEVLGHRGTRRWMESRHVPLRHPGEDGPVTHMLAVSRDITERKRAEQALAENEFRLKEAQRIAHLGSWTWDIVTGELTWSDEIFRIFGHTPGEFTPTYEGFIATIYPADRRAVRDALEPALAGIRPYRVEHRIILPGGDIRYVLEQGEAQRDAQGRPVVMVGTVLDITEREEARRALEEERNFSAAVFDSSPALGIVYDAQGRIVRFNRAAAAVSGFEPGEVLGKLAWEVLIADVEERTRIQARVAAWQGLSCEAVLAQTGPSTERLWRTKSGAVRRIEWSLAYLPDAQGKLGFQVASGLDVTESRAAEEALRESQARYERAVRGSNDGIWDWDIRTGDAYYSPRWLEMLGYSPGDVAPTTEAFLALLHPDDRAAASESMRAHLEEAAPFDMEFRLQREDGQYLWVRSRGEAARDDYGEPLRMAGSITDITEHRRAEAEIRQLNESLEQRVRERTLELAEERNFTATVLDTQEALVVVLDRDGRIVRFNRACEKISGYSREEAVGRTVLDFLIPPEHLPDVTGVLDRLTAGDFPNYHENPWQDRRGNRVLIAWSNSAILDENGDVAFVIATGIDVTQQRDVERVLRVQAQVIDQAHGVAVTTDLQGFVTSWNRHAVAYLGYTAQEAIGRHFSFLYPPESTEAHAPLIPATESGEATLERELRAKDGEPRIVLLSMAYLRNAQAEPIGMVGFAVDIAERKRTEEALTAARARLAFLLTSGPAIIYAARVGELLDATFVSENVHQALGFAPEAFTEDHAFWVDHLHEDDRARVLSEVSGLLEQGRQAHEYRFRTADGRYRWIRDECRLVRDAHGAPLEIVGVWLDVTERVEAERRIARMQDQLAVQQKMATIGQLTATVSHELRNPLGTIRTSVFSLKERLAGERSEHLRILERIERNVLRCDKIINDLLGFSRMRESHQEPTDVACWLQGLFNEYECPEWVQLELDLALDHLVMNLDQDRLRRAVVNVVENAVQAMQPVLSETETASGRLLVTGRLMGGRLVITVRDNGPGMAPNVLERIFEPLFSTKTYGVGLGLPTVKQIMEQEGGGIGIESTPGEGTLVTLWLPMGGRVQGAA